MIFVIWVGEEQTEWPRDRAVKCVTLPHRAAGSEPGSALVGWRVSDKLCSCSRLPSLYTCPGGGCRDRVLRANHCQGLRSGPGVVSTVVNVGHCICVLFTTQGDDLPVLYFGSWGGLSWFLCPWAPFPDQLAFLLRILLSTGLLSATAVGIHSVSKIECTCHSES